MFYFQILKRNCLFSQTFSARPFLRPHSDNHSSQISHSKSCSPVFILCSSPLCANLFYNGNRGLHFSPLYIRSEFCFHCRKRDKVVGLTKVVQQKGTSNHGLKLICSEQTIIAWIQAQDRTSVCSKMEVEVFNCRVKQQDHMISRSLLGVFFLNRGSFR